MNKDSIFLFWLGYMRILLVFFLLLGLSGCLYQQINNQPNLPDNVDQTNEKEEEVFEFPSPKLNPLILPIYFYIVIEYFVFVDYSIP